MCGCLGFFDKCGCVFWGCFCVWGVFWGLFVVGCGCFDVGFWLIDYVLLLVVRFCVNIKDNRYEESQCVVLLLDLAQLEIPWELG